MRGPREEDYHEILSNFPGPDNTSLSERDGERDYFRYLIESTSSYLGVHHKHRKLHEKIGTQKRLTKVSSLLVMSRVSLQVFWRRFKWWKGKPLKWYQFIEAIILVVTGILGVDPRYQRAWKVCPTKSWWNITWSKIIVMELYRNHARSQHIYMQYFYYSVYRIISEYHGSIIQLLCNFAINLENMCLFRLDEFRKKSHNYLVDISNGMIYVLCIVGWLLRYVKII